MSQNIPWLRAVEHGVKSLIPVAESTLPAVFRRDCGSRFLHALGSIAFVMSLLLCACSESS